MRTIEKVNRLKDLLNFLNLDFYSVFDDTTYLKVFIVKNWFEVKAALDELHTDFDILDEVITQIFKVNNDLQMYDDVVRLNETRFEYLTEQLDKLKEMILDIKHALEKNMVDDQEAQLNIKLPDDMSIQGLSDISKHIVNALNDPLKLSLNGGTGARL
jgi:hypothetical protein